MLDTREGAPMRWARAVALVSCICSSSWFLSCSKRTDESVPVEGGPDKPSAVTAAKTKTASQARHSDINAVLGVVRDLKTDPDQPYHCVLRDIYLATRDHRLLGNEWQEVSKALAAHGAKLIDQSGDSSWHVYVLTESAYVSPTGCSHDLFVWLHVLREDSGQRGKTEVGVRVSDIGLTAAPKLPFERSVARLASEPKTVLNAVLNHREVREVVDQGWVLIDRVYASYDPIHDRWSEYLVYGFHVKVQFGLDAPPGIAGKRLSFTVDSNFDPPQTWDGNPLEGFKVEDTLGRVRGPGGNEWWHGSPETVKANMAKYLKPAARAPNAND